MSAEAEAVRPNSAWVEIASPLSAAALRAFLADAERLLRINPLYEIASWQPLGGGRARVELRYLFNDTRFETELRAEATADGLRITYVGGLKQATEFALVDRGARLRISDLYPRLPEAEMAAREQEFDRSLVPWGNALHRYLKATARWGRLAPWRWFMRRLWLPARPSARRIMRLLFWLTVVEFAVFLLIAAVFVIEQIR